VIDEDAWARGIHWALPRTKKIGSFFWEPAGILSTRGSALRGIAQNVITDITLCVEFAYITVM
jgi:hypothetical protein